MRHGSASRCRWAAWVYEGAQLVMDLGGIGNEVIANPEVQGECFELLTPTTTSRLPRTAGQAVELTPNKPLLSTVLRGTSALKSRSRVHAIYAGKYRLPR